MAVRRVQLDQRAAHVIGADGSVTINPAVVDCAATKIHVRGMAFR